MEDDLTHKYCDIIKTNRSLKQKQLKNNAPEQTIEGWSNLLQYHAATLIDNQIPGIPPAAQRSGRPLKSVRKIEVKRRTCKGNLGKRARLFCCSVITPDPNISEELGVPKKIAMNLTFPDIVTKYNINQLTQYIRNGPKVHPGALSYKDGISNITRSLEHIPNREDIVLKAGDTVYRHLMNGDNVLFNRQPSLHKMSRLARKVRVMPYSTLN